MNGRDFVERMSLPMRQAVAAVRWLEGRVSNRPKTGEMTIVKSALTDADCVSQEILLAALLEVAPEVELKVAKMAIEAMASAIGDDEDDELEAADAGDDEG